MPADSLQSVQFFSIAGNSKDNVYMVSVRCNLNSLSDPAAKYYYHKLENSEWIISDSMDFYNLDGNYSFGTQLSIIGNSLYGTENGIYKNSDHGWIKIFNDNMLIHVFGQSENNYFACGGMGTVYHYNGIDWKKFYFPELNNITMYRIWLNEKEVFITGSDGTKTYVLHGK
jgi:hypothetical protein